MCLTVSVPVGAGCSWPTAGGEEQYARGRQTRPGAAGRGLGHRRRQ